MRVIEGDLEGSDAYIVSSRGTIEIRARLLSARDYDLKQDMRQIDILDKETYHSFWQWILMILLGLTGVGLLIAIPVFIWGKKLKFYARFQPQKDRSFTVEGGKEDWQELQAYLNE